MEKISITVRSISGKIPEYQTQLASGADLLAYIEAPLTIEPGKIVMVPTGLYMEIPSGWEAQVRPRSGLAAKYGITALNSPGTIDADYRGEIKVILINHGQDAFVINNGERIAQIVFAPVVQAEFLLNDELSKTVRGEGGFGSTGR